MLARVAATPPAPLRRWRVRLIWTVLLVGGLVGGLYGLKQFLESGTLAREMQGQWREHGRPGHLSIGSVEILSFQHFILREVSLAEHGAFGIAREPVATVQTIEIFMYQGTLHPERVVVSGARLRMDEDSRILLEQIAEFESRQPGSSQPRTLDLQLSGEAVFASGSVISRIQGQFEILGPRVRGTATGVLDDRQLKVEISGDAGEGGARRYTYRFVQATARLGAILDAAQRLFPKLGGVPDEVRAWFPDVVTLDGSELVNDPGANTWDGPINLAWARGGSLRGNLHYDSAKVLLTKFTLNDDAIGTTEDGGRLLFDQRKELLTTECRVRRVGSRPPIPPELPRERLRKLLPTMLAEIPLRRASPTGPRLEFTGSGRSRLTLEWIPREPLRITAADLPLDLAQGFVPAPLEVTDGLLTRLDARIGANLERLLLGVEAARLRLGAWTFGPVDARAGTAEEGLLLEPLAGGGIRLAAVLPSIGRFAYSGTAEKSEVRATMAAMEAMIARWHGPSELPQVRGGADLTLSLERQAEGGWLARITRLGLSDAGLPDSFQHLETTLKGEVLWKDGQARMRFGGQLLRGGINLPGRLVDVASRTPIFTAVAALTPSGNGPSGWRPGSLAVEQILIRAAVPGGDPRPQDFSAEFTGRFTTPDLSGSLRGVIDNADLDWFLNIARIRDGRLAGKGGVTFAASIAKGGINEIAGSFLPFGNDLTLGPLTVSGITGEVQFKAARE